MPNDPRPRRRSLRLPAYDYSQAGAYFITICTQARIMLFGDVIDCDVRLNEMGTMVQQTWDDLPTHYPGIDLDAFVVMPNHVHGIIILADQSERRHAIPEIVRGFKTFSARRVNERAGTGVGAGFKPALSQRTPVARYCPDRPPIAQDCSRCKRECDPTSSRRGLSARNCHAATGWSSSVARGRV